MADFIDLRLEDGTQVLFQTAEASLVQAHGGVPDIRKVKEAIGRVENIAKAAGRMCESFKENLTPDELTMEIGVGLSGEVGWFFAKSAMDASIKLTITWKPGASK